MHVVHCIIQAEEQSALAAAGLDRPDLLFDGDLSAPITCKPDQTVYRIKSRVGDTWYLKRSPRLSLRAGIGMLRRRQRPHTQPYRQYLAAKALEASGFRVMRIAMAAERRLFGVWPTRGFILARPADGVELGEALATATRARARLLWRGAGRLLARLHRAGFYHAVRLHDLFTSDRHVDEDGVPELTLIDPDFKDAPPRPQPFSVRSSIDALALCAYLFLRCGKRASPTNLRAMFGEYRRTFQRCNGSRCALAFAIASGLRDHFVRHFKDQSVASIFTNAPPLRATQTAPLPMLFARSTDQPVTSVSEVKQGTSPSEGGERGSDGASKTSRFPMSATIGHRR